MLTAEHEVLVVGAGISGLSVTAKLIAAGVDVVCVEARDRIGGRLLSVEAGDGALDLGATWFWPYERRVQDLVAAHHLGVFPQHTDGDGLYEDGTGVQRTHGNRIDGFAFRYATGAQSLPRALAATLPRGTVILSRPVTAIATDLTGLTATAQGIAIRARHVVLAAPPALVVADIRFDPPLPDRVLHVAQATPVFMGTVRKAVVHYPQAFWRSDGLAGAAVSGVGPMQEIHDMSGPDGRPAALFGFIPNEAWIQQFPSQTLSEQVVAQLVRLFGQQAASPADVIIQDWTKEPFTSPPGANLRANYRMYGHSLYSQPTVNDRLHWASTETSAENPGHVEGALAASERVVRNVLRALSLTDAARVVSQLSDTRQP